MAAYGSPMTREEAQLEAARLQREHPDRGTHTWMARRRDAGWQVVRFAIPGAPRPDPLMETTESRPRPPQADDPRPAHYRNAGPWAGGI